jgi:hypothetical protein
VRLQGEVPEKRGGLCPCSLYAFVVTERKLHLVLALATLYIVSGRMAAQGALRGEPVIELWYRL